MEGEEEVERGYQGLGSEQEHIKVSRYVNVAHFSLAFIYYCYKLWTQGTSKEISLGCCACVCVCVCVCTCRCGCVGGCPP